MSESVGEPRGFEEFFVHRVAHLVRLARHLLANPADAEDVVQEVVARLAARWGHYRAMTHLDAYVRTMVTNACISHQRRPWYRRERAVAPDLLPDTAAPAALTWEDGDAMRALLQCISPNQRAVLVLRYYEGLSDAEIAHTLAMSAGTVSSHASRGLRALRARAATDVGGASPAVVRKRP